MKEIKKARILLSGSVVSFFLMSASFLLMPIDLMANAVVGIMFWIFFLLGIVFQIILASQKESWIQNEQKRKRRLHKKRVGIFSFMQNFLACIADVICVLCIIGLIVSVYLTNGIGYVCYIFMAMLSFSFCMHCILNGKIYYYITNQKNKI